MNDEILKMLIHLDVNEETDMVNHIHQVEKCPQQR